MSEIGDDPIFPCGWASDGPACHRARCNLARQFIRSESSLLWCEWVTWASITDRTWVIISGEQKNNRAASTTFRLNHASIFRISLSRNYFKPRDTFPANDRLLSTRTTRTRRLGPLFWAESGPSCLQCRTTRPTILVWVFRKTFF